MFAKTSIQPVYPAHIDADPSVQHSFQADTSFRRIHVSSKKASRSFKAAPNTIAAASRLANIAGLPTIERVVATSSDERLMIFSLEAPNASPPGPRIFGLTTEPSVTLDQAIHFVRPLL